MRKIQCYECGKSYDVDVDDCCPKCGAFNQPGKSARIGADGAVVRSEGLNEKNHAGSFLHQEFHLENRVRKAVGLSKGVVRTVKAAQPLPKRQESWQKQQKRPALYIIWIIIAIIVVNMLSSIIGILF